MRSEGRRAASSTVAESGQQSFPRSRPAAPVPQQRVGRRLAAATHFLFLRHLFCLPPVRRRLWRLSREIPALPTAQKSQASAGHSTRSPSATRLALARTRLSFRCCMCSRQALLCSPIAHATWLHWLGKPPSLRAVHQAAAAHPCCSTAAPLRKSQRGLLSARRL